jgi:hypothetical protein
MDLEVITYTYPNMQVVDMADNHTRVLCVNNAPIAEMNTAIFHKVVTSDIHEVGVLTDANADSHTVEWLCDKSFHTLCEVALGARVMLTCNGGLLNPGVFNGSCGTVVGLEYGTVPDRYKHVSRPSESLMSILVRMDHTGQVHAIHRTKYGKKYVADQRMFSKATFPLQLAYAISVYRSPRLPDDTTTIIAVNDNVPPSVLYMMLSNVAERKNIQLLQRLTPDMFTPIMIPK